MQEELQRERDERNYYQMERDRIDTFWEVTRRELGTVYTIQYRPDPWNKGCVAEPDRT